jgi:dTDP-4-dehydrorhamnose reductase
MKILITGANGLLGQKLVAQLQQEGGDFLATGRGKSRLNADVPYRQMDITSAEDINAALEIYHPEVIIHTAAMTNVDECELNQEACRQQNIESVRLLTEACSRRNIFFLHLSTDFIFSGKEGPLDEEAKPAPVNFYGESKLEAEKIVQAASCPWAIARTVLVYGVTPGMSRSNIILWVKKSLEDGKDIKVVNDQWRTPTLAEDLADGCLRIAKNKAEGIWNISGPDMLTPLDMAYATAEYFNLDKKYIEKADSSTFTQPAKRPPKTGFKIDKARRELGYSPHSFIEGIELMMSQLP